MTLGEIIREYRAEHRLSQRQFADLCSRGPDGRVTNGYISMVESGKNPTTGKPVIPSIDKIALFAQCMGMSLHHLLMMADDMPVYIGSESEMYEIEESTENVKTDDAEWRSLSPGWAQMTKEERQRAVAVVKAMFPDRFTERNDDDDPES